MPDEVHTKTAPFKLVFEDHPGYFFACVEAEAITAELTLQYNAAIAAEISNRQADRVMIKRDVPLRNNTGAHCAVMYMVRGWSVRRMKYAFVDVNPAHINFYKFALMYANDKGIEAEVFSDIDSAKVWLLR